MEESGARLRGSRREHRRPIKLGRVIPAEDVLDPRPFRRRDEGEEVLERDAARALGCDHAAREAVGLAEARLRTRRHTSMRRLSGSGTYARARNCRRVSITATTAATTTELTSRSRSEVYL